MSSEVFLPAAAAQVIIRGSGVVSALGLGPATWHAYAAGQAGFQNRDFALPGHATGAVPVAALAPLAEKALEAMRVEPGHRGLDRAALLAILAGRLARKAAGWQTAQVVPVEPAEENQTENQRESAAAHETSGEESELLTGVGIGSSRGATGRLEEEHARFLATGQAAPTTSPLTTPGNLASGVAHDWAGAAVGPLVSHSSTCSSALQALGSGLAWLQAGLADRYLAGGTEAPLTAFTVAQLRAVGIYSPHAAADGPCRPGQGGRANTFVLGEGAAVFALERAVPQPGDVVLRAVGFGFERSGSKTGITPDGQHFQLAMRRTLRLAGLPPAAIDTVVLHAPGTAAGDAAELAAVAAVFGDYRPELATPKHLLGHTLGASAALSLDYALWLLRAAPATLPPLPYRHCLPETTRIAAPRRRILLNAAGFGGNAACALVELST